MSQKYLITYQEQSKYDNKARQHNKTKSIMIALKTKR